ncbi:hypothetical protein [Escherichia coli]|uniref:hypothetical protein n=1 Tax=Escherichia coli TaxID=562 RepID=UPI000B79F5E6
MRWQSRSGIPGGGGGLRKNEAGVLIIAELFSEVVTVSQPVPGEQETDITDGIRLSDWYYKYKKSSESNVKDLPE